MYSRLKDVQSDFAIIILLLSINQWRTQKILMGGSFSGVWFSFVFVVRFM